MHIVKGFALAIFLTAPGAVSADASSQTSARHDSVLTIAITPRDTDDESLANWAPLMRALTEGIAGYEFRAVPISDTDSLVAMLNDRRLDLIVGPPITAVILERAAEADLIANLSTPWNSEGLSQFGAAIITRSDRFNIRTITDLTDRSIMGVAREGAGCWLAAKREMHRFGIDPERDCSRVEFSRSQRSQEVVRAVRDGIVDAGVVRTGIVETMVERGDIDAHEISVIQPRNSTYPQKHTTRLYPAWGMAKGRHVTADLASDIVHVLLHIEPTDDVAVAGQFHGWTAPQDYSGVHAMMRELGHPLFLDRQSPARLLRAYWKWFLLVIVAFAMLGGLNVYTSRLNIRLRSATAELTQAQQQLETKVEESASRLTEYNRKLVSESTVRTATETALRESEHKYRQLVELAQEGIWVIDAEGVTTFVNPSMGRMLGYSVEEMIGRHLFSFMDERGVNESRRNLERRQQGFKEKHDFEFLHRNGHTVYTAIETVPLTDDGGNYAGAVAGMIDITERKRVEQLLSIRANQQEALAEIGRMAVSGADLDDFLNDCVEAVARAGRVDLCKILQLEPDRESLLLRAGIGWKAGLVGRARVPATRSSQAGFTLQSKEPVVSKNFAEERRFTGPPLLTDHGVVSGVSVPIGHGDTVWGILGAHTRTTRDFGRDDVHFFVAAANLVFDAVKKAETETSLRAALSKIEELRDRLEAENTFLREESGRASYYGGIVGESAAIRSIAEQIDLVAPTGSTVLILGESGTGKELVAREIHTRSPRADRPLIAVNCASIPENLYESEFFGHVTGAFTGAVKNREGRFELANRSTLFLDEIAEIPIHLQSKLLRVLQEGQYERVGSETTLNTDMRLIAATNRDLLKEVEAGRFREDLFYRLNVFPIEIPPLRERPHDMAALARHFLTIICERLGRSIPRLTQANIMALQGYHWPGNVRELQNVIERAVITLRGDVLRFEIPGSVVVPASASVATDDEPTPGFVTDAEMRRRERANTVGALERAGWQVFGPGGAAALLGIKPTTLASRMKRMGIERQDQESARETSPS